MLSSFESALLDRHLRKCASCRAFANETALQTELLRGIELEPPPRPIELPERASRRGRKVGAAGAALAVAAVAAISTFTFGSDRAAAVSAHETVPPGKELVVYGAQPTPNSTIQVPRLRIEPATYVNGPAHGPYDLTA